MKRNLKKALAITLVVAMFALSTVSAFAENWDVVYVRFVPSSEKIYTVVFPAKTTGYYATCTKMTNTPTRGVTIYGDKIGVKYDPVVIAGGNPVFNDPGTICHWKIVWGILNAPEKAPFKFVGYSPTIPSYTSFTAQGTVGVQ